MRHREPFPSALLTLAHRQDGVLSRRQLLAAGLADSQIARFVEVGTLRRLDHGIVTLGWAEPTWRQYAWAGVLLGGPGARLMRRSAGAIVRLVPESLPIEVATPAKLADRHWVRFIRAAEALRFPVVGRPPATHPVDTVLDLCGVLDEPAVAALVVTAAQRTVSERQLRAGLAQRRRLRHRALLEAMVGELLVGVRSPLELRWVREVERPHGLPRPRRNVTLSSGRVADVIWDAYRTLVELDGRAYHPDRFRDWRRDNVHAEDDWLTLRYGWTDVVGASCAVAGNAGRVLNRRGWRGTPRRCPACP